MKRKSKPATMKCPACHGERIPDGPYLSTTTCGFCGGRWKVKQPSTPDEIIHYLKAEGLDPRECFDHFETDGGMEVERVDDTAPDWFGDTHAVLLHRVLCGCLTPENKDTSIDPEAAAWATPDASLEDTYGGRTCMPFPTFSATAEDLKQGT